MDRLAEKSKRSGKKHFTVEQANKTLPLVRAIVGDLVRRFKELCERRERLKQLQNRGTESSGPYREETEQIAEQLQEEAEQLQEYLEELQQLGVEFKDPVRGLVDFPAMMDGREVYLCWQLGEPEVAYWHELDAGIRGRQPLPATAAAEMEGAARGE